MIWLYLSYAAIITGSIKLAMMLIMQIAGDINDINLQNNYKRLSRKKGLFKPKISAVMLAANITSDFDLYVESVISSTIQPNEFVIIIDNKDRKTYNKLRYYRDKHGLGGYIKLVRHSTNTNITNIIKKNCIGTYLVMFDGTATPQPMAIESSLALFRDESTYAVLPNAVPKVNTTLKSASIAVATIVRFNYFRAQRVTKDELYGILFVRKSALVVLANNGLLLQKYNIPESLKASSNPKIVRHSLSLVNALGIKPIDNLGVGIMALWVLDILAIAGILYMRGSYEGWILIGFVSILALFLVSIAILGYKGTGAIGKLNLILMAPLTYMAIYGVLFWQLIKSLLVMIQTVFTSFKRKHTDINSKDYNLIKS